VQHVGFWFHEYRHFHSLHLSTKIKGDAQLGSITAENRGTSLDSWKSNPSAEVLIIGGGINGISTLRDLALQGVKVALVERRDFVSGSSAASSHMIHGGVRYLEHGEFRLVKESLQERNRLLKAAPHCVRPLRTTIPIFSIFSGLLSAPAKFLTHSSGKPKERGALLIKVGLIIYDTFGRNGGVMPRHRFLGRKKTLEQFPQMHPEAKFSATYFDASMDSPERLSLEVLSDALATGNARAINYCEATGTKDGSIVVKDHVNGETFNFKADVVINASGPWTDLTNGTLGVATAYMGGTKGSHIVVDNPELLLACNGNEIFFENADGRIVLMYPLLDRVLIGSSDIRVDIAEPVSVTEEEIDYFFELVSQVFPKISVTRDQIVYRYTGVRPLPAAGDLAPGFVSRDYRIEKTLASAENGFSLLSLIGGKWTTFRALGEHLANETLSLLGKNRLVSTASMPIGGGKGFPQSEAEISTWLAVHAKEIDSDRALVLLHRYGTKAEHLLRAIQESGETRLNNKPEYSDLEIRHLVDSESVVHLADVLFRRTTIGFRGDLDLDIVREIGQIVATELGWSKSKLDGEIDSSVQEGQVGSK